MEFVKGTILPLEEDIEIEFKMHTKLCTEEILKNRTRRAISRLVINTIWQCSMLCSYV